jgi:hypothetical protein
MSDGKGGRIGLRDVLRVDIPKLHAAFTREGVTANPAAQLIIRIVKEPRNHRQLMRVLYCPPLPLLWGFRPGDGTAAALIHQVFARALWRNRSNLGRLRLLAYYLVWPPLVIGATAWMTLLNGRSIRRLSGKGSLHQMADQLRLAAQHAILPPWYYMFELWDDARLARAGQYLTRDETKGGIYRLLGTRAAKKILQNKGPFAHHCHAQGVRTPATLEAKDGQIRAVDGQLTDVLPRADLFAKPGRGRGGRGAEKWHYDGAAWSLDGATAIGEAALLAHFRELTKVETYLIQPRLDPHADLADLSGNVLTTVRMVTIVNESGVCEATHAVFRMPNGPEANVDNFHAGGLAAKVDIETGELGPSTDMGLRPSSAWHTHHPHTGAPIAGRKLPFWKGTIALARHAHASMTDWTVIGWDIAICDDGPVIIEGNCGPDLDIIQRAHREPMGDSRFGELLAHHLAKLDLEARLKLPA